MPAGWRVEALVDEQAKFDGRLAGSNRRGAALAAGIRERPRAWRFSPSWTDATRRACARCHREHVYARARRWVDMVARECAHVVRGRARWCGEDARNRNHERECAEHR